MNCFHVHKSGSPCLYSVLTLHPIHSPQETVVDTEGIHPDVVSRHIIFPASLGVFQYLVSESIPDVSLWVLARWYLMSWCAADVTDGDKTWGGEGDCAGMTVLLCESHLFLFFFCTFFFPFLSFPSPSHLLLHSVTICTSRSALSLHHFLFLTPPLALCLSPCPLSRRCWSWPSLSSTSPTSI